MFNQLAAALCFFRRFLPVFLGLAATVKASEEPRLMVDFSDQPAPWVLSAFDLSILKLEAKVDLEVAHALGNRCLARVSLSEIAKNSPAEERARHLKVPLLEGSADGLWRLDATHPRWVSVVVHEIVEAAAVRGFDGVMLSGLETISQDAERAATLRVMKVLKATFPDKLLFMEGGFDLLAEARRSLDGIVFIEKAGQLQAAQMDRRVREATRQGVRPFVVGFADPEHLGDLLGRAEKIRELGGVPFFTTSGLDGTYLGPLQEIMRRVLVLHRGDARQTFTAKVLHGSLEWLGYQVRYQDVDQGRAEDLVSAYDGVTAVVLDRTLILTAELQQKLVQMVSLVVENKLPLLLTGQPWHQAESWKQVAAKLCLQGSGREQKAPAEARLRLVSATMLMEQGALMPRTASWHDLRATEGARVCVSLQSGVDEAAIFDQVFLADWGGVWLDPLSDEAGPQVSPLAFLEQWLAGQVVAPVADTTSQDGQRLLVSQITAEGFAQKAGLPGLPMAAEAMRDQVLKRYKLPFSVALCEGDLRGFTPGHDPHQALRLQEVARSILALAHVEAASYSYSRPQDWSGPAAAVSGVLNTTAPRGNMGIEREIAGSLVYLHREILPEGSQMAFMAWPAGVSPRAGAVDFSWKMGVENVETVTQPFFAGRAAALQPRSWGNDDFFQSFITQNRRGQALEADRSITEAQRHGQDRWLSPVQVALRFEDVKNEHSLRQVHQWLDWCASQPLQAVTVGQYARICRDAARTRVFQTAPSRWIIVNGGQSRTLRLPASAGVPDLMRCTGVAGYTQVADQLYIHLLGLRRTELVMQEKPLRDHLRLASSTANMRFLEAASSRALFQVATTRPVELVFAGIPPGTLCQMTANGRPEHLVADNHGRIEFIVPHESTVQLRVLPTHQSAMR